MITEDYVSFEVAKLLKEKGFDEPCRSYYIGSSGRYSRCTVEIKTNDCRDNEILRPTLQTVCKWLREVHNYIINIWYDGENWASEYYTNNTPTMVGEFVLINDSCSTYEEAVEAAIKYCLENLI